MHGELTISARDCCEIFSERGSIFISETLGGFFVQLRGIDTDPDSIDLRLRASFSAGPEEVVEIDLPALAHRSASPWGEMLAYARAAREAWNAYAARPGASTLRIVSVWKRTGKRS